MKKIIILSLFFFLSVSAFSITYTFSDLKNEVSQINAHPESMEEELETRILHPLVKMKSIIVISTSDLIWDGDKCKKKITSFKQTQGQKAKRKGNGGVGETYSHKYISEDLTEILDSTNIINWESSSNLQLMKKTFSGYKFKVRHKGDIKECCIFQNKDKSLHAISIGFADAQIEKGGNIKDQGIVWFFSGKGSDLKIVKVVSIGLKKSNGVPYVELRTLKYSNF